MRAIHVHAYGQSPVLDGDVPDPVAGDGQLVVRVAATSVNPWEIKVASGMFRDSVPMTLPYVPGSDFAGTVEVVGPGVTGFKVGQRVFGHADVGSYAERIAAPAATTSPLPPNFDDATAAAIPLAGQTAWQGVIEHGQLRSGQTVLIHGASGGVGSLAVQFAKHVGARVIATGSGDSLDFLRSLGADGVVDYRAARFEDAASDVDLVLDLIGGETQARSFAVLKAGGRLISTVQPPSPDEAARHRVSAMVMGMTPTAARLTRIGELVASGSVRVPIDRTFPLAQVADAWQHQQKARPKGKVVLSVG
ncbi:MAG TPA: NADP-dependent oxidoreductase [Tepidisphaeraceae bacterium]|nr:NADP-dependent oxidoreductase [Tepidisphaeraceae bacterium]